jgi:HAD superfamily hydrolase (TIGR01484 family)
MSWNLGSMSKYRALVFDIDGTAVAVSRDARPSPRLLRAIESAEGRLELFAATGRSLRYAAPTFKQLGLKHTCAIGGGTSLVDPQTGEIIEQSLLSHEKMAAVQSAVRPFKYDVHLSSTPTTNRPATHGQPIAKPQPYLLLLQVERTDITPILQALGHIQGIVCQPSPDWDGGHTIQVTNDDATKEHRIRQVLDQLGITPEETVGVGDGDNDIHLFAAVGHKVAMGNASEQLKSVADEIAPSLDDDGLAVIIEKYSR